MQLGIGVLTIISTPPSYGGRHRAAPGATVSWLFALVMFCP